MNRSIVFILILYVLSFLGSLVLHAPLLPEADMYNGLLLFVSRWSFGDVSLLWAQHNEHRILLSRVLFLINEFIFGGGSAFLVASNLLILMGIGLLFWRMFLGLHRNMGISSLTRERRVLALLSLLLLIFSWLQKENLLWGFQSQFLLVYLVPGISFYCFALYLESGLRRDFVKSIVSGAMSLGTMINGVLALPVLVFIALLGRQKKWEIGLLTFSALLSVFAYFYSFSRVTPHEYKGELGLEYVLGVLQFYLVIVGRPFWALVSDDASSLVIATVVGALVTSLSIYVGVCLWRSRANNRFALPYLGYILFLVASIGSIAVGRSHFGLATACTPRYLTPALLYWSVTFLALIAIVSPIQIKLRRSAYVGGVIIFALFFIYNLSIPFKDGKRYGRSGFLIDHSNDYFAALAMTHGIHDEIILRRYFPSAAWLLENAHDLFFSKAHWPFINQFTSGIQFAPSIDFSFFRRMFMEKVDPDLIVHENWQKFLIPWTLEDPACDQIYEIRNNAGEVFSTFVCAQRKFHGYRKSSVDWININEFNVFVRPLIVGSGVF